MAYCSKCKDYDFHENLDFIGEYPNAYFIHDSKNQERCKAMQEARKKNKQDRLFSDLEEYYSY